MLGANLSHAQTCLQMRHEIFYECVQLQTSFYRCANEDKLLMHYRDTSSMEYLNKIDWFYGYIGVFPTFVLIDEKHFQI